MEKTFDSLIERYPHHSEIIQRYQSENGNIDHLIFYLRINSSKFDLHLYNARDVDILGDFKDYHMKIRKYDSCFGGPSSEIRVEKYPEVAKRKIEHDDEKIILARRILKLVRMNPHILPTQLAKIL